MAPRLRGHAGEMIELRPRRFRVDVVGRHRRHAAPIVDAGPDELRQILGPQVRRRLNVDRRAEDQAGDRDRPQMLVERRLGRINHPRAGLGAEVLDDDFLDVAVARMKVADREQRRNAFDPGLADADQQSGGEWHGGAPGRRDGRKPHGRMLVGRAEMRPAALRQPFGRRLQHDALRHRHLAQAAQPRFIHHAGIEVRQQAGLLEHQPRAFFEIIERGGVAERGERVARGGVAALGLIAEREQGFLAAGRGTGPRDRQHLVAGKIGGVRFRRRLREGAVVAHVAAQLGERNEDLLRKRNVDAMAGKARALGRLHQRRKVIAVGEGGRFIGFKRAVPRRGEQIGRARLC